MENYLWVGPPHQQAPQGRPRFFPSESDLGSRLALEDVRALQSWPSALYRDLIDSLARRSAVETFSKEEACRVLAREPVVLLTYVFLDRFLRFGRLLRSGRAVAGLGVGPLQEPPARLDRFRAQAGASPQFNQFVLSLLAPIWDIKTAVVDDPPPEQPLGRGALNYNFSRPDLARRIRWKIRRELSRRLGRWPALGLAYAEPYFLDAGLIGPFKLADLHGRLPEVTRPPDAELRRRLFDAVIADCRESLRALLSRWGFSETELEKTPAVFADYLSRLYPSSRLEDIPVHLPACLRRLAPLSSQPLLLSETGDVHTAYMLAAAKTLGMKVVGIQHGAHYGFFEAACYLEGEYPYFDRFITWGWNRLPDRPLCGSIKTIPLPSPWLSRRQEEWRRAFRVKPAAQAADFDVLLMTDRLQDFPPPLNTLRLSRLDYLPELGAWLKETVLALTGAGLRVLHKPFNDASARIQKETMERLHRQAGELYSVYDQLDKGMTHELLGRCRLVLWDEPGTGFFECLVSGIPAMLYRPAVLPREASYAAADFAELEEAGLIHAGAASLTREIAAFRADPEGWMAQPRRRAAVEKACRRYAWTEEDWARRWADGLAHML